MGTTILRGYMSLYQAPYTYAQEVLFHFFDNRLLSASDWSDLFLSPHSLACWA